MQQQIADDKLLQFQAGLAKVKQRFIESLPVKVAELDSLLDDLYEDGDTEKVIEAIGQRAHKLHGLSGSFGFTQVGAAAAKLEREVLAVTLGPRPIESEGVEAHVVVLLDLIDFTLKEG